MSVALGTLPDWLVLLMVVVTLAYVVKQLRSAEKSRKAELLLHFTEVWDSGGLVKSRNAIQQEGANLCTKLEQLRSQKDEQYFVLLRAANLFETLGFLLDKGYVKMGDVEPFATAGPAYYERFEPWIRHRNVPHMYQRFASLAKSARDYHHAIKD